MKPSDESDDLWRLLGQARPTEVSPFFSRNVLREVRNLHQEKPGIWDWLRRPAVLWTTGAAAAVALSLAGVMAWQPREAAPDPLVAIAEQVSASPDFLVITDLDELLASEETSVWLEKPVY